MQWQSGLAIYLLFWVFSAFVVLPFGVRTTDEAGEARVAGQADSAPAGFRLGRILSWTTVVATVLFSAFLLNYLNGWVSAEALDFYN